VAGAGVMNGTYGELFSFFFADHSHQSRFSRHILNYFLPKFQTKFYAVCRVAHSSTFESPPDETELMTMSLCNPASESAFAVYCKERTDGEFPLRLSPFVTDHNGKCKS
jgi:hypothetical protein